MPSCLQACMRLVPLLMPSTPSSHHTGSQFVLFDLSEDAEAPPVAQQLDAALAKAAAEGIPVRCLLIANPNNPCGTL